MKLFFRLNLSFELFASTNLNNRRTINFDCRFYKVFFVSLINVVNIFLRIAVDVRKPCAVNLNHHPMPFLERVQQILQSKVYIGDLIRSKGLRLFKTISEAAAEDFTAH